jgi:hypothetical protein
VTGGKLLYLCSFKAEEMTDLCIIPLAQRERASLSPVLICRSISIASKPPRSLVTASSIECSCSCSKSCYCCCYAPKTTMSYHSLPCSILPALPPLSDPKYSQVLHMCLAPAPGLPTQYSSAAVRAKAGESAKRRVSRTGKVSVAVAVAVAEGRRAGRRRSN